MKYSLKNLTFWLLLGLYFVVVVLVFFWYLIICLIYNYKFVHFDVINIFIIIVIIRLVFFAFLATEFFVNPFLSLLIGFICLFFNLQLICLFLFLFIFCFQNVMLDSTRSHNTHSTV